MPVSWPLSRIWSLIAARVWFRFRCGNSFARNGRAESFCDKPLGPIAKRLACGRPNPNFGSRAAGRMAMSRQAKRLGLGSTREGNVQRRRPAVCTWVRSGMLRGNVITIRGLHAFALGLHFCLATPKKQGRLASSAKRGQKSNTSEKAPANESGEPGGGRGRSDHVGRSPVYPGSGPWPSGNVEIRTPDSFVHGDRDDQGREIAGGSEPIYYNQEVLLGDLTPIQSLIASGSKVWLDSVDPEEVARNRSWGITGATSNPIIVADLVKTGRLDGGLSRFFQEGLDDYEVAWRTTDLLVRHAQEVFAPVCEATGGDDGYVSFELDPLLEDPEPSAAAGGKPQRLDPQERTRRYIELGKQWSHGHRNRMIKVPATASGLAALEELAAAGVTVNVTLTFTPRQYVAARDALWRGAQRRQSLDGFKSVYSIFVSRVDVYTEKHVPGLSAAAQGQVGIVNAKRIWRMNQEFWADKKTAA